MSHRDQPPKLITVAGQTYALNAELRAAIENADRVAPRLAGSLNAQLEEQLRLTLGAGKDLAVSAPGLDRDGKRYVMDFVVLERGEKPPIGQPWTVYRLGQ